LNFKSKGHKEIPSSSLIPENDSTTLFISAGMQPLVPYFLGKKHSSGKRIVNVQKCIRTTDIEKVGNGTHHTFFEMLGNWSLGDYWKKEAIEYSFEFLTKELKIPKEKLTVSVFKGDKDALKDVESEKVWLSLGIPKSRIAFLGKKDNWWGPAGLTGPCGPDTEMFVNDVEIWNDVFIQYNKTKKGTYEPLKQKNVDTGMGVERTIALLNRFEDNYLADMWKPIIEKILELSHMKSYSGQEKIRIIADHIKASVFIIAEGVEPSNSGQGYILRRLIRRCIRLGKFLSLKDFVDKVAEPVFEIYKDYPELKKNKKKILEVLKQEEEKFNKTLEKGLRIFDKKIMKGMDKEIKKAGGIEKYDVSKIKTFGTISGKEAFLMFQSYGFPLELIKEEVKKFRNLKVDEKAFKSELKKHQKLSRVSAKGKFSSGLADDSEQTTKLHTATHLLNESLRKVLGKDVKQKGSNITSERLRFDFNFPRKLTEKEIKKIEKLVNKKIKEGLKVTSEEMPLKKALASKTIQAEFGARYPEIVSVYSIENFSKEICTGPHVKNTSELGQFKIIKEQSSSAGIRRIKAVVE